MTLGAFMLTAWDFEPSIVIGCAALLAGYFAASPRPFSRAAWFVSGVVVMFLALVSPLDALADNYLFSAHMVQHMLLILVVPPLLILGLPATLIERALKLPGVARGERILAQPALAWTIGIATEWLWHWPAFYNAALASESLHVVEHLCFLVSAVIFWWPIFAPLARCRLAPLAAMLYLAAGALAGSLLGILLTFADAGLYPAYLKPNDVYGILSLVRDSWGITAAADQQLGGLLMWVPGGAVFLLAIIAVMARWYGEERVTAGIYAHHQGGAN
ncbi:MAG TPA: cytochrome c oxidase assembly protein [Candidatus Binataceae bacterium]|nr:cytochrome c oxidase assembly protein [Candidatus Binataceae bacterium]